MTKKKTTIEFIEEARSVFGDRYDYSSVTYVNSRTPVKIICRLHGEFKARTYLHLNGEGCPECKANVLFIEKAKKVYGNKYDFSKVDYISSKEKVCIICPVHGEFWKKPSFFLMGLGCPKCSRERGADKRRTTIEQFLELAHEAHGDKYDYSNVEYHGVDEKVEIICPIHGSFWQTPYMHSKEGQGCPICGNIRKSESRRKSLEEFINEANEIHERKYDYSETVYTGSGKKVIIICPIHGRFKQIAADHLNGSGCPKCSAERRGLASRKTQEQFLEEAKQAHGDEYDYSRVNYDGIDTPVEIVCRTHGSFFQTPYTHLKGSGCPKCAIEKNAIARTYTTEMFIEQAKKIHGDKYDYSKVEYINSIEKVCIVCLDHGEFWQMPSTHISGCGCPSCKNQKTSQRLRKDTKQFLHEAHKIHGNKYDYSNVEYLDSLTPVEIICPEHGLFLQKPASHLAGHGCPSCAAKRISLLKSKSQEQFIKEAKEIHGDRYDYSLVEYSGSNQKITIICRKHGTFEQAANGHLQGYGCPKCAVESRTDLRRGTLEDFVVSARSIHGDKYDYTKAQYVNSDTPLEIICPKHGSFFQSPYNHATVGQGCPKCAVEARFKTQDDVIADFISVHGDRYDYSDVEYTRTKDKVAVRCRLHGIFWIRPDQHLAGHGCPECSIIESESILERSVKLLLQRNKIDYEQEKKFPWLQEKGSLRLDFFLPQYNVAIECQGKQHFEAVDYFGGEEGYNGIQRRDELKRNLCESHNIKVLYYSNLHMKYPYEVIEDTSVLLKAIKNNGSLCNIDYPRQLEIEFED